ncbi:hypothetical protein P8452_03215 [Trifolium repens]|nr:hypothetical protein P8452_03215 [Trifolium repens]
MQRKPPKAKAPDEAKSGAIPKSDANPSTEANASQQPNSATVEVSQVDNPTQNSASVQADHSANVQADQLGHQRSHQIIYLAMKDAFSIIQETTNREFLLRVSYLEIYNEKILLNPAGQNLRIREDVLQVLIINFPISFIVSLFYIT